MMEEHDGRQVGATPIDDVGRTALVTAQWRLEESRRPDRLFDDSLAACFLDGASEKLAARLRAVLPEAPRMIVLRTRYIDDWLTAASRRVAQVVVLGAGFDTRRLRCDTGGVAWFEVDRRPVLDFKRACLRRHGLETGAAHLACDYVRDDFVAGLVSAGFDPRLPSYVIWEGNTFFLPLDDVVLVLLQLCRRLERFEISFDYMSDRVISRSTGDPRVGEFAQTYADLGAGFVSGLADLPAFARDLGLEVADHRAASELARRHLAADAGELRLFEHYFLATLRWSSR
ncbi:MAG: SAM-dependent methyltransferase [Thermodesulfobacteriota bacterium]